MTNIVVGVDGSESSARALEWAARGGTSGDAVGAEEARFRRAALQVVHVWQLPYLAAAPFLSSSVAVKEFEEAVRRSLDEAIDGLDTEGMAQPVEGTLASGGAASAVLEAAQGADLVVVGSRGHGGFSGLLLGSVSQQIAHATCPAVVVPSGA